MDYRKTEHGFGIATLVDGRGTEFSIQESSSATDEFVWVGVSDPDVQVGPPWKPLELPGNANIFSRGHFTRDQAREIAEVLLRFAETGLVDGVKPDGDAP